MLQRLKFDYEMQIEYEEEVAQCHFTIKCLPKNTQRQTIEEYDISLFPPIEYVHGTDGLKNLQIYGRNARPHTKFIFRITGTALVGLSDFEEDEDDNLSMIFRHPHGMNQPGENISAYYNRVISQSECAKKLAEAYTKESILKYAEYVMERLHGDFEYQPNTTGIDTTAEEAFCQGYGVCQDYAHIYIALMHQAHIAARYVTGLIVGEGASHAWVEVLADGKWYGFDPTNKKRVEDEHIKIGVGRDAHDCMINRGIMHGGGFHTQTIRVSVTKQEGDAAFK